LRIIKYIIITLILFTSCAKKLSIQKRKYNRGFHFSVLKANSVHDSIPKNLKERKEKIEKKEEIVSAHPERISNKGLKGFETKSLIFFSEHYNAGQQNNNSLKFSEKKLSYKRASNINNDDTFINWRQLLRAAFITSIVCVILLFAGWILFPQYIMEVLLIVFCIYLLSAFIYKLTLI